jgi:SAM-dependent methyltransferase
MTATATNHEQHDHWSGPEGDHWVTHADRYDRMLAPFADQLMATAAVSRKDRVLDIGCGCGATTIAAAQAAFGGVAMGVDLSPQMLETATARAHAAGVGDRCRFEVADAQTTDFGGGRFDVAVSRFGVMFFDDPVAAFTNIATALRPGGRLVFCCWQFLEANDWMLVPGAAAAQHVPLPEAATGTGPGPFALADPAQTRATLFGAGFEAIEIDPFTTSMLLGGGGTLDETVDFMVASGSGRALLDPAPADARRAAISAVRDTLAPLVGADGVRLGAGAWVVTARTPG